MLLQGCAGAAGAAEKLVLTGFLALWDPSSIEQLFVATAFSFLAFVLQARVSPYATESDNLFAFVASLALAPIFLGSLSLQTETTLQGLGKSTDHTLQLALLMLSLRRGGLSLLVDFDIEGSQGVPVRTKEIPHL